MRFIEVGFGGLLPFLHPRSALGIVKIDFLPGVRVEKTGPDFDRLGDRVPNGSSPNAQIVQDPDSTQQLVLDGNDAVELSVTDPSGSTRRIVVNDMTTHPGTPVGNVIDKTEVNPWLYRYWELHEGITTDIPGVGTATFKPGFLPETQIP